MGNSGIDPMSDIYIYIYIYIYNVFTKLANIPVHDVLCTSLPSAQVLHQVDE